jgi:hypothetical protein
MAQLNRNKFNPAKFNPFVWNFGSGSLGVRFNPAVFNPAVFNPQIWNFGALLPSRSSKITLKMKIEIEMAW